MKLLIILNGECRNYSFLKKLSEDYDRIFCADGGYKHAKNSGIVPNCVFGDFDSVSIPKDVAFKKYPTEKDETDTEIAINEGLKEKFENITLTCTKGGRCDHFLTNFLMLCRFENVNIIEDDCIVEKLNKNTVVNNQNGKTVSFVPLEKTHIELNGFKYYINDEILLGTTRTMSNVFISDNAEVKIEYGSVLMIITK